VEVTDAQKAIRRLKELPTLPAVLTRILHLASDPESSALDLAKEIAADQSLAARLLRLVNSAFYGFHRQVDSVSQAVVILGYAEVRDLVLAASAFDALPKTSSNFDRDQLWRHAIACGMASERIARSMGWATTGGYYCAGLLHDIGKVAFDVIYPREYAQLVRRAQEQKCPVRDIEREVFGFDHAYAGAQLAAHWDMPDPIIQAIQYHHDPVKCRRQKSMAPVIALADYITYEIGLGETSNGLPIAEHAALDPQFQLDSSKYQSVIQKMEGARNGIHSLTGILDQSV